MPTYSPEQALARSTGRAPLWGEGLLAAALWLLGGLFTLTWPDAGRASTLSWILRRPRSKVDVTPDTDSNAVTISADASSTGRNRRCPIVMPERFASGAGVLMHLP